MGFKTIRILRPGSPTHYYGKEMKPKRRVNDVTPFDRERDVEKAFSVVRRDIAKKGDTVEVGVFPPENVSSEQPWTPFELAVPADDTPILEDRIGKPKAIYLNSRYTVFVYEANTGPEWPPMIHLSIKRNDKEVIRDWRELQRIKNELVGPENEGIELFPAESRLVDTANQYHLFVLVNKDRRFPFGWETRLTMKPNEGVIANAKQREFEKEASCPGGA